MRRILALICCLSAIAQPLRAESALIAVATNFLGAAERLAAGYGAASGHEITLSAGATGKLYAQIIAGAPYDALLSADSDTVSRLVGEGRAVAASRFTYAFGALALWSPDPARDLSDPRAALETARHVAIANPALAPYGKAAMEAIESLEFSDAVTRKIVMGENIGQAQLMVASGAAEIGFVAASATLGAGGAQWPVPVGAHAPIRQDAALLQHGAANKAAAGFLAYLASDKAKAIITTLGYGVAP
ncbi:MAG: molybdate ABC transporter substrate-binding protein [Albidovulum sp.]